ncbi:Oxidoreductase [Pichia californica]|uniref:Mitochondrial intermembrane space import and assembly protein 40 n=1 Tax=Pichia californica TaxID=460514 RepID=A0A9P6WRE6_9ASCO|nr:Oxidoreductase [[Candida] californica]KAG0690863.1 Oxidoreductase [[Candida] californica]
MFSLAARSIARSSRPLARRLSSISHSRQNQTNYVPFVTISACAITSGSMYYYFMNRIKNETATPEDFPATEDSSEKPVEVIEVIEVIEEEDGDDNNNNKPFDVAEAVVSDQPALEEEAAKEGAFNEETGEINWDCPCLGGMAHGPCGEDFKAAFSCFVYSKEEPKGIECIDKFKAMQDCFRQYPDVYSDELRDEEALESEVIQTERAVDQAVMNNDIIESIDEAIIEANEIKQNVKELAFDIYGNAQKKIDEFKDTKK